MASDVRLTDDTLASPQAMEQNVHAAAPGPFIPRYDIPIIPRDALASPQAMEQNVHERPGPFIPRYDIPIITHSPPPRNDGPGPTT
jgi:hypothetical protein